MTPGPHRVALDFARTAARATDAAVLCDAAVCAVLTLAGGGRCTIAAAASDAVIVTSATRLLLPIAGAEGAPVALEWEAEAGQSIDGGIVDTVAALADVLGAALERLTAHEARARREQRLHAIIDSSYDGIITFDLAGRVEEFNLAAEWIFGWSARDVVGEPFTVLFPDEEGRELADGLAAFRAGRLWSRIGNRAELRGRRNSGEIVPVELIITAQGGPRPTFHAFVRDVSDLRRLEADLRYAQKLEAVGQLASGIAHEINTPIQFIGDNMHFLRDAFGSLGALVRTYRGWHAHGLPDAAERARVEAEADVEYLDDEVPKALEQTLDGVSRVATIVRALKEFAHPGGRDKAAADLNHALRNTLTVAQNEIKHVADLETDFGDLPPVMCHVGDLNQVFLNLIVNAAHAIEDAIAVRGGRGRIRLRTRVEGSEAVVTVADDGCGIPDALRNRIYDPMFTTKAPGRGTGQGLALARAIVVEGHGGRLCCESEPGQGTTFTVAIPLAAQRAADRGEACAA